MMFWDQMRLVGTAMVRVKTLLEVKALLRGMPGRYEAETVCKEEYAS